MVADSEYQDWLRNPSAQRVLLAELHHSAGIEYVANRPFISLPGDSLPNQPFNDLLVSAVDVSARIDGHLDAGDIELVNDGSINTWAGYLWRGHSVVLRLGDPGWSYDDFRIIANQVNSGLQKSSRGELVLGVEDASARLEKPLSGRPKLNGKPVPLVLGSVIGARADRLDTQTLAYRCSWLPVTSLVMRDGNGPVMTHTPDYANGGFVADAPTNRTVMCDVEGPHNTAGLIIQWVADQYGLAVVPLSLPDYVLGLRYEGDVTGKQILDDVCRAFGGYWSITLAGELQVSRLTLPVAADLTLYAEDIEHGQISMTRTEEPWASLTLDYAQNHSPITEVAGSIVDNDSALDARLRAEWLSEEQSQPLTGYPLAPDESRETALVDSANAAVECGRLLGIRSERREVWELDVFIAWAGDVVGLAVTVEHSLLQGQLGRVISSRMSPIKGTATLEVWF